MTEQELTALATAQQAISAERAEQILNVKNWEHGGCLSGNPCPFPRVTAKEHAAIKALWDSIPDGSSSWMTAFYRLRNSRT